MRKLNEIIADVQANVMEACAAGYVDGLNIGLDMTIDKRDEANEELCDAFIRVWNERYELCEKMDELEGQVDELEEKVEVLPGNYLGDEFVYCSQCKHHYAGEQDGRSVRACLRHDISAPGPYAYCYWGER